MKQGLVRSVNVGRMGNFLFETAAAAGYAWRHGMEFTVPNTTRNPKWNPIYLQHLVKPVNEALQQITIKEQTHGYQDLPFREEWRSCNITLDGYWQSEKYFKEFRDRIIQVFGFQWDFWKHRVSIHVRRTDYLELTEKHPPVPKAWFEEAMGKFVGYQFIFFSDDIEWCKREFADRSNCFFSEGKTEVEDLVRQSWCEHNICSASTFAWWAAWLNQNPRKRVIMPKNWFQPGYRKTDTKDIVPAEWERL